MNNLLLKIVNTAIKAGDEILKIYNSNDFHIELKKDNSPLTKADIASNKIIIETLQQTGLPVISEENKEIDFEERKNWGKYWLVDPLDGTKEFIKRNGHFTVNIALINSNISEMGVVYLPYFRTLYFADINFGAYKCEKITDAFLAYDILMSRAKKISCKSKNERLRILASQSHFTTETQQFIDSISEKSGQDVDILNIGSSLKFCTIAEGEADIYPRFGPTMEWDIAAGHAVLKASGGNIIDVTTKKEIVYNKENLLNNNFIAVSQKYFDLSISLL
jgi:3'(2'), 5'-bisphosphate nucleotidase